MATTFNKGWYKMKKLSIIILFTIILCILSNCYNRHRQGYVYDMFEQTPIAGLEVYSCLRIRLYDTPTRCAEGNTAGERTADENDNFRFIVQAEATVSAPSMTSVGSAAMMFTDDRDGKVYRMVRIGDQTWMAENLNYSIGNSWCYENNKSNCQKYGRLYDWNTAMTACPAGWHLPTHKDWGDLVKFVGGNDIAGKKLKSVLGWDDDDNNTDEFGFSALPGGYREIDGSFVIVGSIGYWWSATESVDGFAWYRGMMSSYERMSGGGHRKVRAFSVRCVKDVRPFQTEIDTK